MVTVGGTHMRRGYSHFHWHQLQHLIATEHVARCELHSTRGMGRGILGELLIVYLRYRLHCDCTSRDMRGTLACTQED